MPVLVCTREYHVWCHVLCSRVVQTRACQLLACLVQENTNRQAHTNSVQVLSRGNRRCAGKELTEVVDFINTADHIRTAFVEYWGECVWGGGQAAAEARAAGEVDACLTRLLALLRCPTEDGSCRAVSWEQLTLSGAARRLVLAAEGAPGAVRASASSGGAAAECAALLDLDRYIDLCQKMNARKLELPLEVASELRRHVLASVSAPSAAAAASSPERGHVTTGSDLRLRHVELTHAGAIHVEGVARMQGCSSQERGLLPLDTSSSSSSLVSEALRRAEGGGASSRGGPGIKGKGGGAASQNRQQVVKQGDAGREGKTLRELAQLCAVTSGVHPQQVSRHVTHLNALLDAVLAPPCAAGRATPESSSGCAPGVDVSGVTGILQRLDLLPITKEVLVQTGIGKTMKQLSKHAHPLVAEHARSMVARWKALLRPTYPLSLPVGIASHAHGGHLMWPETREHMIVKLQGALETPATAPEADSPGGHACDTGAAPAAAHLACVARDIEYAVACASVHVAHGSGGGGAGGMGVGKIGSKDWYHQKVRQLLFNLRDGQNTELRERVKRGDMSAKELVAAQPQALANAAVQQARSKARETRAEELQVQLQQKSSLEVRVPPAPCAP